MCARVHGVVVARDAVAAGALALAVVAPRAVRAPLQHVQLIWRQNHTLTHSDACKHHGLLLTQVHRMPCGLCCILSASECGVCTDAYTGRRSERSASARP